ncbi:hypothetical protein TraAM80_01978 [Trypanosoma rangeli]|uniref:Uncharacterized protein n=1 Tax=Trypanosoma rangeli TaxID=5698 RepID=A0A3R7MR64_TRYRA|nr:uncharacterized protein TraAM80_01978 [Trypanosoma rangeli]RNF09926.1 hypothetical protein TraAM80_01978 [Trypanosoma rangeli]|eukprot:RNF09926.1 hypothetical protein TraAM80_01978 [Trypanosoma rangeli]
MLPMTCRRWSDSPVYDIVAHAPSTQASVRAPSLTGAPLALPLVPAFKQKGNFQSPLWTLEKQEENSVKDTVAPAVTPAARSTEKGVGETQRLNCFSVSSFHPPSPVYLHVEAEVEAAGRRACAGAEAETVEKGEVTNHLPQPKYCQTPHPCDDQKEVERTPPWEIVAQVETVQEIVRRSRETGMQCEADVVRYLRPEEQLLWRSLKKNLTTLHDKALELTAGIREWEKVYSADALTRVKKRLRLIQSKKHLLLTEWEKVEDLCWEDLTAQLLHGAGNLLGALGDASLLANVLKLSAWLRLCMCLCRCVCQPIYIYIYIYI